MEIRLIEISDAENFVKFYDKIIRETQYLLPTVEESAKTVEQQENSIKKYGENKHVGVSRIEMTVISENKPAISCYERNGYKREGTREKSVSMNNKYYDEVYMAKMI